MPRPRLVARLALTSIMLLALMLAGCTKSTQDPATFECTHTTWVPGKSTSIMHNNWNETSKQDKQDLLGTGLLSFQGHPLDMIEMDFHVVNNTFRGIAVADGRVTLRITDDAGRTIQTYMDGDITTSAPSRSFTDVHENFTLSLHLAPQNGPTDARSVTATWTFTANADGDPRTGSGALLAYQAKYWYRTCTP